MMEKEFGLSRVGQISVTARDLGRAVGFYRDTLGMRHLFDAGDMAFFDCSGIRLMLGVPESPEYDHPASIVYYSVEDIHAAHATLESRGVEFVHEPRLIAELTDREIWMAFFPDTEGNTLALMSEVPRAAGGGRDDR